MTSKKKKDAEAQAAEKQAAEAQAAAEMQAAETEVDPEAEAGAETPRNEAPVETLPPVDDRYLRLQADFDNFRKRVLREKEDLYRRANEDIMENLLPVLDHLELAFASAEKRDDAVIQGFELVAEQLKSVLLKFGLEPIETDGVDFDPNVHEAILHMPSETVPENGIVSRTRAGYMLGNRLLRPAQVVVSSGAGNQNDETKK